MCPLRNTTNIVLMVSMFVLLIFFDYADRFIKGESARRTVKMVGRAFNVFFFGMMGYFVLQSFGIL